jgi:hypothetical protein
MAEDGAFAARQHRCHPSAFIAQSPMPDRVNPAMNAVQAASAEATRNTGWGKASRRDLRGGDHAMLVRGDAGDRYVRPRSGSFLSHTESKSPSALISPLHCGFRPVAARRTRCR